MPRSLSIAAFVAIAVVLSSAAASAPLIGLPPLFQAPPKPPPPSLVFRYAGWRVDASRAAHTSSPARTVRAVKAQIDIVERLGLSPDTLSFMRGQPIRVDGAKDPQLEGSQYVPGGGVLMHAGRLDAKKPILLFALLEAYQAERLPGGAANAQTEAFRRQAVDSRAWPSTARMLQSNEEFFALNAGAYLYGAITREPYTRADLKKTQPQCYRWLAELFDGGRPRG
jgi:hypothetical protein